MTDPHLPKDEERALEEHLAELRNRLIVVLLAVTVITIVVYPFSDTLLFTLKGDLLSEDIRLIVLSPLDYIVARIKIAALCALVIGIPLIIFETFQFMRPGLFPSEERFILTVVPFSILLFVTGAALSYFALTPLALGHLVSYTGEVVTPALVLSRFISFITFMLLSFGLIFQIPLVVWLLLKSNLIGVRDLKRKRKYVYAVLIVGGVLLSPEPTPLTPLFLTAALVIIYEISVFVAGFHHER
ncbi:MAG: twin-arginine translocase subunit TatC [Candidatus Hydrothermarchaeaceae archaeon]